MKKYTVLFISIIFASFGFAQESSTVDQNEVEFAEKISAEFSVSAIPALNFISSDPADISRPSSVKKLAANLYNGINEEGNVKQGLAIEAKMGEFMPISVNPQEYRTNQLKFILYNTQLSLGTIATSGDSTSTDLGWGIRLTIFDDSDPMKNKFYLQEFKSVLMACAPTSPLDTISKEDYTKCVLEKDRPVKDSFDIKSWNAKWMTIAYAGGSRLKGSQISKGKIIGHQVWLSGGLPIDTWGQFSYLAKWSEKFNDETSREMQELEIGGKILVGGKSYNLFAEASYNPLLNKADFEVDEMVATDNAFSWTLGVEFKITNGIWAVTGLGEEADRIIGNEGIQLLSGIRMGISDKSRLKK